MLKRLRKAHPILFCVLAEVVFLASLFVTDLVFTIALVLFRTDFASIDTYLYSTLQELVGAMVASQKAGLSFSALMQVRNKLMTGFDDIMRMPL